MKPVSRPLILLLLLLWTFNSTHAFAQAQKEVKDDEARWVNLGAISFSPDYILAKDFSFIIFKIRNNTNRSISNIFGWVYRFPEEQLDNPRDLVLMNNPNQGAVTTTGQHHPPRKIREWRFSILPRFRLQEPKVRYTLRVSPKSIFFSKFEPQTPPPPPRKSKKKN